MTAWYVTFLDGHSDWYDENDEAQWQADRLTHGGIATRDKADTPPEEWLAAQAKQDGAPTEAILRQVRQVFSGSPSNTEFAARIALLNNKALFLVLERVARRTLRNQTYRSGWWAAIRDECIARQT